MTYNVALCFCPPHKYTPQKNAINSRFVAFFAFFIAHRTLLYILPRTSAICLSGWLCTQSYIMVAIFKCLLEWLAGWILPFFRPFYNQGKNCFSHFRQKQQNRAHTARAITRNIVLLLLHRCAFSMVVCFAVLGFRFPLLFLQGFETIICCVRNIIAAYTAFPIPPQTHPFLLTIGSVQERISIPKKETNSHE